MGITIILTGNRKAVNGHIPGEFQCSRVLETIPFILTTCGRCKKKKRREANNILVRL